MKEREIVFLIVGLIVGAFLVRAVYSQKYKQDLQHIKNNLKPFLGSDMAQSLGIDSERIYNQIFTKE